MPNLYVTLETLKSKLRLDIETYQEDSPLMLYVEQASRRVDGWCGRHFYEYLETKHFDGNGGGAIGVPDLIAITTLKTDDNDDRTFETTWAATDYFLLPHNADPATRLNPNTQPYWKIEVDGQGNQSNFPSGRRLVEINGGWGYWRHLRRATETANAVADAATTSVTVSDPRTDIQLGHTILIDSEQMFVESFATDTLTVIRGLNGTTATSHSGGADIDIYEYPTGVQEAAIVLASWELQGRGGNTSNITALPDGSMQVERGINPWAHLDPYKLPLIARFS